MQCIIALLGDRKQQLAQLIAILATQTSFDVRVILEEGDEVLESLLDVRAALDAQIAKLLSQRRHL